jgi:hypothetical protein
MVAIAAPLIPLGITGARVAGPYIANLARQYGPMAMKGLINLMSKKDDKKKTVTIDEEGKILPDLPDQMPEPDDEDPKKKTTIRPLSPEEIAKKLAEEGLGQVIDKGVEKLEDKFFNLKEQKKFELEQADPADLDDSLETITQSPDAKGKLIEVGGKTTEGTFRYKGETYNKSDGVRLEYGFKKGTETPATRWVPKEKYGKPNIPPTESGKTRHVAETIDEINKIYSPGTNLHELTHQQILDALRQSGYNTTASTIFTAKNTIMQRGPTTEENRAKRILDPEGYEARDIGKSLQRLDKKNYDTAKNFLKEISPNKLEKDILNNHLQRMVYFAKREGASEGEIIEALNNVDKEKLISLLTDVSELRGLNKQARDLGINPTVQNKPYAINLSHKEPVKVNWRKSFDPNNLFVSDSYGNLILQPSLEKQIKSIKENLKNYKTLTEKKEFLKESMPGYQGDKSRTIKEVRQAFKDNRLISIFGDKVFGSSSSNDPYFVEQMRDTLLKRLETGKFKKDGGMVGISHLIRPL